MDNYAHKKSFDKALFSTSEQQKVKLLENLLDNMNQTNRPAVQWCNIPITRINTNSSNSSISSTSAPHTNIQRRYKAEDAQPQSHSQAQKQSGKRVTWSENLLDIRNISPRQSKDHFKFPAKPSPVTTGYLNNSSGPHTDHSNHFICGVGQTCRLKNRSSSPSKNSSKSHTRLPSTSPSSYKPQSSTTQLNCSPQLQKVVYRAVKADRDQLAPKHGKQFPYQNETNSYDWKPNRNHLTLNFPSSEDNLKGRKI